MALRKIRWRDEDYRNLKRAVNHFNNVLNKVGDNAVGFLDKLSYKELKSNILTRKGLNDTIARLQRLNVKNATNEINTLSGLKVSQYEVEEARIAETAYKRKLKKENWEYLLPKREVTKRKQLEALKLEQKKGLSDIEYEKRYNKIIKEFNESQDEGSLKQMGSDKAKTAQRNLEKDYVEELLEKKYPYEFKENFQRLLSKTDEDYRMLQTIRYKEHYLDMIEQRYSTFDNYELFLDKVKKMSPEEFYKFMDKDELTVDLTYQSDQHYQQQEFDAFLRRLDILPNETGIIEVVE
jgi:hypothetical protein